MKNLPNLNIMSALANVKRVSFVLFGVAMLYVTPSLLCSCSGNSKGNAGNGDNGNNAAEQQATEPVKSEKEQDLESAYNALSRLSYTIFRYDMTKENKTTIDKDGYQNVSIYYSDGSTFISPFAIEDWRHAYIDGTQITYNPRITSENLSSFILNEVVFILTKKSLQGDPMVSKRYKEIDISQYLYYLIFRNEDANDFVKERVQMHYDVAMEQMLEESNYVHEVANSSASEFTFKFEPSLYKDKYKIKIWFDGNGYLVVNSTIWQ